jgi:hypothetical protein
MKDLTEDKDYELWVLLAQAREAMYTARQKELRRYDLSPRQSAVYSLFGQLVIK